jgi:uncharacterized protein (DUF58 family)
MTEPFSPLDPKVLAQLAGLKVQVHRVVEGVLAGLHRSPRHGVSIDFSEHKAYTPGDDLRHLDWKVLGRLDRYTIKKFEDETNLQATVAIDLSGSMDYRSTSFSKAEYACLLGASLATLLLRQGDAVGLQLLSGTRPIHIPPAGRPEHLTDLVAAIEASQPAGPTRLRAAVERYIERAGRRGMLVLFSDLLDPDPELLSSLKMLSARGHEVVVFQVLDRDELDFPFEDPSLFVSLEDERSMLAFPREVRAAYLEEMERFLEQTRRNLAEGTVGYQLAPTDEPPSQPLLRALSGRASRTTGP